MKSHRLFTDYMVNHDSSKEILFVKIIKTVPKTASTKKFLKLFSDQISVPLLWNPEPCASRSHAKVLGVVQKKWTDDEPLGICLFIKYSTTVAAHVWNEGAEIVHPSTSTSAAFLHRKLYAKNCEFRID